MSPVFDQIVYFHGEKPLDGALQMAIDELLLIDSGGDPVILRDYLWSQLTTSIGYFETTSDLLDTKKSNQKSPLRRPTGGGLVEHGHGKDYTYSVLISAPEARCRQFAPRSSYHAIHAVLAEVLRRMGIAATLASDHESGAGGSGCFVNPVGDDLMLDGIKIAGAGQKRSRGAILHQGSVQPIELPPGFGKIFASALARKVVCADLSSDLLGKAEVLADEKYRSPTWNLRR